MVNGEIFGIGEARDKNQETRSQDFSYYFSQI
jgi:hypothetical protein